MTIQAKPTTIDGVHYRSRLEARWSVFFDAMRWPFVYEPPPLVDDYLPDFLLTVPPLFAPIYVEVKPESYADTHTPRHDADLMRWAKHVLASPHEGARLLVLIGAPGQWTGGQLGEPVLNRLSILYDREGSSPVWFAGCDRCGEHGIADFGQPLECSCFRAGRIRMSKRIQAAAMRVRDFGYG